MGFNYFFFLQHSHDDFKNAKTNNHEIETLDLGLILESEYSPAPRIETNSNSSAIRHLERLQISAS